MKIKISLTLLIILSLLYWFSNPSYIETKPIIVEEKVDSTVTVTFSSVGDIMCHSTQYNYSRVEADSFDFRPVFEYLKDYLNEKDILFGNLETVLAGETKKYSGYPFFNTPNEMASALKYAGFDFLFTSNNHANDQGYDGVKRTIEVLRKENIVPLGTHIPGDSIKSYNFFVRKGLRFGVLSYTYGTNYKEFSLNAKKYVNHIDSSQIKNDILDLRNRNVDVVIVYFHYGTEYNKKVSKYQMDITSKTVEYGADIILASHPHIIQPFEKFKTNNTKLDSGFVAYSLGNFISNQRWRYSDGGLVFNFKVTKNIFTDSVYISEVNFLPIWVFKGKTEKGREYKILPSQLYKNPTNFNYLTPADLDSMKRSYFDTIELFTAKSKFPKIDSLQM